MRRHSLIDEIGVHLGRFLHLETTASLLLVVATVLAMLVKNSPLADLYLDFLNLEGQVRVGAINVEKALFLWVNDGWMAIFFFMVGLEIKREMLHGHLRDRTQIVLPAVGAIGGVLVPALIYSALNWHDPVALKGWAIPTATDIAFALGVLALLGRRVPTSLKIFLMTLAIIDDLIAIIVIAFFYTSGLSTTSLTAAAICLAILFALNRLKIEQLGPYVVIGVIMWVCVLKSGVHATLAGVIVALIIPSWQRGDERESLAGLIEDLHPWVAFAVLPAFAFVNAGIDFSGLNLKSLLNPVPLGIALALVVGKTVGVFTFAQLAIRLRWAPLPDGVNQASLLGVSMLCGIGFTMSLFIGGLAFAEGGAGYARIDRLGIIIGSLISALAGYAVLRWSMSNKITNAKEPDDARQHQA